MVNLALYSDQIIPENSAIDARLLEMMKAKSSGNRIAYVPSGPEPHRRFFGERKSYYARLGLNLSLFHDLAEPDSSDAVAELFACDAIHLSGGHTGGFLRRLKHGGMLGPLRDWARQGGILIGTSAGAILMTPTIAIDALFSGRRPEGVVDGDALDLLPFEFFPHLNAKPGYLEEIIRYSTRTTRPIIAVNDGAGVVVSDGMVDCIGNTVWIIQGAIEDGREVELSGLSISRLS